jgi:EmrB/QacA subfamily drug resistance transporter
MVAPAVCAYGMVRRTKEADDEQESSRLGTEGLVTGASLTLGSAAGRWAVAATVLGSGAVFLEGTVTTVALPAIGRDFELGLAGLQWLVNAYMLPLSALILLGGSLGDRYGRRQVFITGLIGFAAASGLCMVAPDFRTLVACRLLQGIFGALLVPNSLAILDTLFTEEDRSAAIGQWAGWSGISTALGPLVGGWLADALSWRWVFACVVPFALAAAWIATRKVPAEEPSGTGRVDYAGAVLVTLGLAGVTAALLAGSGLGRTGALAAGGGGLVLLAGFVMLEHRVHAPLLQLDLFRSRQFAGANLVTLLVYAALGGFFFLFVLMLQDSLGYSALASGAALLPVNLLMLIISPVAGRWSARVGARLPMTVGAVLAAGGLLLLSSVGSGSAYVQGLVPGLALFGVGLATLVAPLTAAVMGAVPEEQVGVASAVNNATARLAGLLGTAVLPLAAGLGGLSELRGSALADGVGAALRISAGLCLAGAVVAFLTIRATATVEAISHPSATVGCIRRAGRGRALARRG